MHRSNQRSRLRGMRGKCVVFGASVPTLAAFPRKRTHRCRSAHQTRGTGLQSTPNGDIKYSSASTAAVVACGPVPLADLLFGSLLSVSPASLTCDKLSGPLDARYGADEATRVQVEFLEPPSAAAAAAAVSSSSQPGEVDKYKSTAVHNRTVRASSAG